MQKARPGQFNMLYVPGLGECAISLSGLPDSGLMDHTIRSVGNVTAALTRMTVGDSIGIRGPFGSWWPVDECVTRDVIIVGGGIGLAPLRPVIAEIVSRRDDFGQVSLLIGARSPTDLLFASQYDRWRDAGIHVDVTVDRADSNWNDDIGVVTLLLDRLTILRPRETVMMACGPEVMMMYAIQSAIARGLPTEHLWLSLERNMNCALGTCGHCQFGPHFICKDGPVLRFDRVASLMEIADL